MSRRLWWLRAVAPCGGVVRECAQAGTLAARVKGHVRGGRRASAMVFLPCRGLGWPTTAMRPCCA
jgi:hypothetical protein